MTVYDRKTGKTIQEKEFGGPIIDFLYGTAVGRIVLKIVTKPFFSRLAACYYKSPLSKTKLKRFVWEYGIQDDPNQYRSFNDFFTRKKEFSKCAENEFPSVADAKLLIKDVGDVFTVKGSTYDIRSLTGGICNADRFRGYKALLFRLSVQDIHRYIYPDNGEMILNDQIPGRLHTVRPISAKYRMFHTNSREVTLLSTERAGVMLQVEVGALLVGKIVNHRENRFGKFDEKGYFEFGGSTIILFVDPVKVRFDEDLLENSRNDVETIVHRGERIGEWICQPH